MAWKGTGRSGIGDQTITGEYEDWNGLSMNGRQFKNRLTQETRDLSGADYWHMRKALEPKVPEDIPTFVRGVPNISAFAEPQTKPKAQPKKSAFQTITLADSHYERLANLSEDLDKELESGKLSFDDWVYARKVLDVRLEKAWLRLCKARGWNDQQKDIAEGSFDLALHNEASKPLRIDYSILPNDSVFAGLKDENVFKKIYANLLTGYKALSKMAATSKKILEEGLV